MTATAALLPQVDAIDDVSCVALRARPSSAPELVPAPAACSSSGAIVPVNSPPVSESTFVNALLQVSACDIPVRPSPRLMSLLSDSKRQSMLLQQPRSRRTSQTRVQTRCVTACSKPNHSCSCACKSSKACVRLWLTCRLQRQLSPTTEMRCDRL